MDNAVTVLPEKIKKQIEENETKKERIENRQKQRKLKKELQEENKLNDDNFHSFGNYQEKELNKEEELHELFQYLQDEQKNNEINLKVIPALIIKVLGQISEEKYL